MPPVDLTRATWFKSRRSNANGSCVEIAFIDEIVAVRDSKNPQGPALIFNHDEWAAFLDGAKNGEFDR